MNGDVTRTFLVLADIGGYTRFIRAHGLALLHAEKAITELMESVLACSEHPLRIHKLEGDAVLLYALAGERPEDTAREVARQVAAFFPAFAAKRHDLEQCNLCRCPACLGFQELEIKAIAHVGEVLHKRVRQFEELAGAPVIVVHRLLKNRVALRRYVLFTEAFDELSGGLPGRRGTPHVEACEGVGPVRAVLYDTADDPADAGTPAAPRPGIGRRIAQLARFEAYWLARKLWRRPPAAFRGLDGL